MRGGVFFLLLSLSMPLSVSPPCMQWPTLMSFSATSKISLVQPILSLQSHYDSLSLSLSLTWCFLFWEMKMAASVHCWLFFAWGHMSLTMLWKMKIKINIILQSICSNIILKEVKWLWALQGQSHTHAHIHTATVVDSVVNRQGHVGWMQRDPSCLCNPHPHPPTHQHQQ